MKDYIDKKGLKTIGEYINEQDQLLSQQIATKQDTLVSGTNIKTLNNSSVLGEGNIDVQEPLVSGTNIKTINNSPILGAGNVEVQEQLVSGTNIKTVNNESILGAGNIDVSVNAATTLDIQRLFRTEYSITTTVTNGSFSGDTSIWTEETAEVTIIPNTGYLLPSSIEVSGATYTYDDTTGVVYLSAVISNVTIAATCSLPQLATPNISLDTDNLVIEDVDDAESYDVYVDDVYATNVGNQNPRLFKGDIISFDALGDGTQKRFRVLKVNGAEVELLALDDYRTSAFNSSRIAVVFDSGVQGLKYADSLVDVAVNTNYYNALSATVKAAIIPQSRIQSMYEYGSGQSSSADFNIKLIKTSDDWKYCIRNTQVTVGQRNIYLLDLDDIKAYFDTRDIDGADLMEMFYEVRTTISDAQIWFASAYKASSPDYAYNLYGSYGYVGGSMYTFSNYSIRPAFHLDISQITYTKE